MTVNPDVAVNDLDLLYVEVGEEKSRRRPMLMRSGCSVIGCRPCKTEAIKRLTPYPSEQKQSKG